MLGMSDGCEEEDLYMRNLCGSLFDVEDSCKCVVINSVSNGVVVIE